MRCTEELKYRKIAKWVLRKGRRFSWKIAKLVGHTHWGVGMSLDPVEGCGWGDCGIEFGKFCMVVSYIEEGGADLCAQ